MSVTEGTADEKRSVDDASETMPSLLERHSPHIQELWVRLYRTTVLFAVVFVVAFFTTQPILSALVHVIHLERVTLITTRPFQFVDLSVDVAFFFAYAISVPYLVLQLCLFIRPAVSPREFRLFLLSLPLSLVLFAVGFLYGFGVLFVSLQALADLNLSIGLANYWDIGPFLSSIILTATLLGVLFQLPLLLTFALRARMITKRMLTARRRVVWAAIFIFVSLLPPTDGLSLIIMSIPLIVLFELTLLLNSDAPRG